VSETEPDTTVLTPRLRTTATRSLFWIAAGIFLLTVAIVSMNLAGTATEGPPLDPTSPREDGTMALAEVLRQQGVDVVVTTTLDGTRNALESSGESSLFFSNADGYLNDDQIVEVVSLAETVVFADPDFSALLAVAPEVAQAGASYATVDASCSAPIASNAPTITSGPTTLRVVEPDANAMTCYGTEDDGFGLVTLERANTELVLLGATDALSNGDITAADNAAFAVKLLGGNTTLVWYTPSFTDVAGGGTKSADELAPGWVLPGVWLGILTLLTAALWRGRRFGPLVIEKLPVTVRSSETMQGRARLYEKSGARLHAVDSLRIGTIRRLAALCGMASTASVDDVILRVSPLTDHPVAQLRQLLVEKVPQSDHELIALSDELLVLEESVQRAIRPI